MSPVMILRIMLLLAGLTVYQVATDSALADTHSRQSADFAPQERTFGLGGGAGGALHGIKKAALLAGALGVGALLLKGVVGNKGGIFGGHHGGHQGGYPYPSHGGGYPYPSHGGGYPYPSHGGGYPYPSNHGGYPYPSHGGRYPPYPSHGSRYPTYPNRYNQGQGGYPSYQGHGSHYNNNGGFNQGGFNQGFNNQGGFNQGFNNQGGFNQGNKHYAPLYPQAVTHQKPVVVVAPQPTYIQPQPTYVHPQPTYVQPQPAYVQPQPAYVQPKPTYIKRPAAVIAPTPSYVQPIIKPIAAPPGYNPASPPGYKPNYDIRDPPRPFRGFNRDDSNESFRLSDNSINKFSSPSRNRLPISNQSKKKDKDDWVWV